MVSKYSLDKLELLLLEDIARIENQLLSIENVEIDTVRESTIATYTEMLVARKTLLDQIQKQSFQFKSERIAV